MAMGQREKQRRQEELARTELPRTVAHPFYEQVNGVLEARGFDEWVERQCARFYAEKMGTAESMRGSPLKEILGFTMGLIQIIWANGNPREVARDLLQRYSRTTGKNALVGSRRSRQV